MVRGSLFLGMLVTLAASPDAAEIGRIKSSVGPAAIERGAASIPAPVGQQLNAGDWLVTGNNGRMGLTFVDNTRFSIGPDSRIALKTFEYDPTTQKGTFIAKVERGSIAVVSGRINKSGGRSGMQIETPDATLEPHGTRFIVVVK